MRICDLRKAFQSQKTLWDRSENAKFDCQKAEITTESHREIAARGPQQPPRAARGGARSRQGHPGAAQGAPGAARGRTKAQKEDHYKTAVKVQLFQ